LAERIHGFFPGQSKGVHHRRGNGKWDQTRYYRSCG
jgi:hypothetical protein